MRVIDLSVNISEKIKEPLPTKILYENHEECVENMGKILFKDLEGDVFVNGKGLAGETINRAIGASVSSSKASRVQVISTTTVDK